MREEALCRHGGKQNVKREALLKALAPTRVGTGSLRE